MIFQAGRYKFFIGDRTLIMGIVNVTPDSFSDGGRFFRVDEVIEHAVLMAKQGADIIDIGGESTRPGAEPISEDEECARVIPLIERIVEAIDIPISIDTTKAGVARLALKRGASIVNDVSGLNNDSQMPETVARFNAGLVLMHRRGDAKTMQEFVYYEDLLGEITSELSSSMDRALSVGVPFENIVVDPGIGFSKKTEQNLFVIKNLLRLKELRRPVLIGASRKSMIGDVLEKPVDERIFGTAATVALGIAYGADIVRVHDVAEMYNVVRMSDAICKKKEIVHVGAF